MNALTATWRTPRALVRLRGMSPVVDDTRLCCDALHRWHAGLADAFAHLDQPDGLNHLAQAFAELVPVESVMISLERKDRPPQLLYLQGIPEEFRAALIERYFTAGYLLDPFCLAVENGLAEGFYPLAEIAPDDFFDSEYYRTYYLKLGCAEDSYYIVNMDEHSKISISLFQGLGAENLNAAQLSLLRAVEPMVRALVREFSGRGCNAIRCCSTRRPKGWSGTPKSADVSRRPSAASVAKC